MSPLFRWFNFYINSSMHVAFAVCALVGVTVFEFDLEVPWVLWFFVFFGSVTGYNFVKYAKVAGLHHHSLTDMLKTIQIFSFICFLLLLVCLFQLSLNTLLTTAIFGVFTFFYAVPLMNHKNLRTLSGLKVFVVALVWAGVTVMVPWIAAKTALHLDAWITFVQRFLLVVTLTLPFEIRDLQYDQEKLKTLPQQFGVRKVKSVGWLMLLVILILEGFKDLLQWEGFLFLCVVCSLIGLAILYSKTKQTKYFASFWVEGIPMLWLGLWYLGTTFLG